MIFLLLHFLACFFSSNATATQSSSSGITPLGINATVRFWTSKVEEHGFFPCGVATDVCIESCKTVNSHPRQNDCINRRTSCACAWNTNKMGSGPFCDMHRRLCHETTCAHKTVDDFQCDLSVMWTYCQCGEYSWYPEKGNTYSKGTYSTYEKPMTPSEQEEYISDCQAFLDDCKEKCEHKNDMRSWCLSKDERYCECQGYQNGKSVLKDRKKSNSTDDKKTGSEGKNNNATNTTPTPTKPDGPSQNKDTHDDHEEEEEEEHTVIAQDTKTKTNTGTSLAGFSSAGSIMTGVAVVLVLTCLV